MTIFEQLQAFTPFNEQEASDRRLMLQYAGLFSDLLTRDNEMAHLTASCWIVNPDKTKVLLAYHNIYDSWAWLGGHADGDGDLRRVALREAQEESGLTQARILGEGIFSLEILGVDGHVRRGRYVGTHLHLNVTYLMEADDRLPIRAKPDENSAVRWMPVGEVLQAVSEPEMRVVYRKLMERAAEAFPGAGK